MIPQRTDNTLPLRASLVLAFILLVGVFRPVHSLESDRTQPIHLEADRVFIDNIKGTSTYEGNVKLSQGSLEIDAQWAMIMRPGKDVEHLDIKGKPVRFKQKGDTLRGDIRGHADRIEYDLSSGNITLTGKASLWQDKDQFSGEKIIYDFNNKRVKAEGGGSADDDRVHVIIQPKGSGE